MSLEIVRLGHPALRTRSRRVTQAELVKPAFQLFLDELTQICLDNAGVGIAAPQVAVNQRVIVIHVDPANPRYLGQAQFPLTVVINPKIESRNAELAEDWEGDLSVGLRGLVPRPTKCTVTGLNRAGAPVQFELENPFHARVFQHEIDHLNGVFFLDRVKNKQSLSETAMWEKYLKPKS